MLYNSKKKLPGSSLVGEVVKHLFPIQCFECSKNGRNLCCNCLKRTLAGKSFCLVCKKSNFLGNVCSSCRSRQSPDRLVIGFAYEGAVKKMIGIAKYDDYFTCLDELSEELAIRLKLFLKGDNFVVCPVPLSPRRLRHRGFNQADIIARILSQELSLEHQNLLGRIDHEFSQVQMQSKSARLRNVKGVFYLLSRSAACENIILVDDVTTTGATLLEASKILRKICKGKIICAVLAH